MDPSRTSAVLPSCAQCNTLRVSYTPRIETHAYASHILRSSRQQSHVLAHRTSVAPRISARSPPLPGHPTILATRPFTLPPSPPSLSTHPNTHAHTLRRCSIGRRYPACRSTLLLPHTNRRVPQCRALRNLVVGSCPQPCSRLSSHVSAPSVYPPAHRRLLSRSRRCG